jgi:hypothetical protein
MFVMSVEQYKRRLASRVTGHVVFCAIPRRSALPHSVFPDSVENISEVPAGNVRNLNARTPLPKQHEVTGQRLIARIAFLDIHP